MRVRTGVSVAAAVCVLAAMPLAASARPDPPASTAKAPLIVGVADDHVKWLARPDGLLAKYRDLGLGAVRITIPWKRGQSRPTKLQGVYLHRAASLVARGQRVLIAVFGKPSEAPLEPKHRRQYCDFLHHVFLRVPFQDAVIWNEANSPQFWPQAAGAPAYEALLATCWRRLHALRRDVNVMSTTAVHHDPAGFVRALGEAYRERGRRHAIVDTFGHNPYPDHAAEPPWVRHESERTVGMADLERLLDAISHAFEGTRQPQPGERGTSVWYLEVGFQTSVPPGKRRFYNGVESDAFVVPPLLPETAESWARDQARQIRDALLLASCQPEVGAFFNFLLLDEDRLAGWQSGVLWRDGTHKPSYDAFKDAVSEVAAGKVDCSTVPGAGGPLPSSPPTESEVPHPSNVERERPPSGLSRGPG